MAGELTIRPETAIALPGEWMEQRENVVRAAGGITSVTRQIDLDNATEADAAIKSLLKELEKKRKAVTSKLDAAKKQIMAQEKDLAAPLTEQHERLERMINAYVAEQMRKRREQEEAAQRAIAESAVKADADDPFGLGAAPAPVPFVATEAPKSDSATFVERLAFEVVNESEVPRQFLSVDEKKIRAFLEYQKKLGFTADQIIIAGVRVYTAVTTRVK